MPLEIAAIEVMEIAKTKMYATFLALGCENKRLPGEKKILVINTDEYLAY